MSGISRRWAKRAELFRTMPLRSFALFLAAVGFLFSAVGVVNDLFNLQVSSGPRLAVQILSSAIFSMCWAGIFSRATTFRPLIGLICFQVLFYAFVNEVLPPVHRSINAEEMQSAIAVRGILITIFIALGYSLFLGFFRKEASVISRLIRRSSSPPPFRVHWSRPSRCAGGIWKSTANLCPAARSAAICWTWYSIRKPVSPTLAMFPDTV